jgi:hypothetical protein
MSVPPAFQLGANYAMLTLHLKTSCLFAKCVLEVACWSSWTRGPSIRFGLAAVRLAGAQSGGA